MLDFIENIDTRNGDCQGLEGLQELHTDFDNWTVKFRKVVERNFSPGSTLTTEKTVLLSRRNINNNNYKQSTERIYLPLRVYDQEDLEFHKNVLQLHKSIQTINNMESSDDFFIDYVIFRLTNGNKCFKFIKSKL